MAEEKAKPNDELSGEMIFYALLSHLSIGDTNPAHDASSRAKFDEVLASEHNRSAASHKHIDAAYLENFSTRVSQKFSAFKSKMKELGQPIHLKLPRRVKSVNRESINRLQSHTLYAEFQRLNAAAEKAAKAKKK